MMATRLFSTLLARVGPIVPECPTPVALRYIREAAVKACEYTLAWRYAQPRSDLLPGVYEYTYDRPADTEVHVLFDAMVNNFPLEKLTLEQALYLYPAWADLYSGQSASALWGETPSAALNTDQFNTDVYNASEDFVLPESVVELAATPLSITQLTPDKYVVLPLPDGKRAYTIRLLYALKPTRTADGMDEVIFNELEDVIFHHALQHLLAIPNVNWADQSTATYHAQQYQHTMTERRARANLGAARAPMHVMYRRW